MTGLAVLLVAVALVAGWLPPERGVARTEEGDAMRARGERSGWVRRLIDHGRWGFLHSDGGDHFFHESDVLEGGPLRPYQKVTFLAGVDGLGRRCALQVRGLAPNPEGRRW